MLDKYDLTKTVVMGNQVLKSEYYTQSELELTINQKKLLLYLISKIEEGDTELHAEEITISDYCELFGISWNGGGNKKKFRSSILSLGKKCFILPVAPGREKLFRWIGSVDIDYNAGTMQIKLDDSLKQYYIGLKKNYTIFQLGYTVNFTSKYSYTLYEYLKSKANMKKFYISASDAKQQFAYGRYRNFTDFKINVLDIAVKEINEKTDLNVKYELVKKGRSYENIIFFVTRKTGEKLALVDAWKIHKPNKKRELQEIMQSTFDFDIILDEESNEPEQQKKSLDEYDQMMIDLAGGGK